MKIKAPIQTLVTGFIEDKRKYETEKLVLDQNPNYTPAYKNELRQKMDDEFERVTSAADSSLIALLKNAIDSIKGKSHSGAGFQVELSNTLAYISAMGDDITDRLAFDMVRPLFGDYLTMQRLLTVLVHKPALSRGHTLAALSGYLDLVKLLEQLLADFEYSFRKAVSPAAMGVLGTSEVTTQINVDFMLQSFEAYIMRDVDEYEAKLDDLEKTYAATPAEVDALFSGAVFSAKMVSAGFDRDKVLALLKDPVAMAQMGIK